jgi:hypothetical protein
MREGEEQAHGDRLDLRLFHSSDGCFQARAIERRQLSVRTHPFLYAEAQPARDEGGRTVLRQVVERGPVLTGYLQHIPEAGGRNEGCSGAPAFEEGVSRDRHAVGQGDDRACLDLRGFDGVHHAF